MKIGKTYRLSAPIAGCGSPVVWVNGKHWRPAQNLIAPFLPSWHAHESGPKYHTTTYVTGNMRLVNGTLEFELRDGTVIR